MRTTNNSIFIFFVAVFTIIIILYLAFDHELIEQLRHTNVFYAILSILISLTLFPLTSLKWRFITNILERRNVASFGRFFKVRILTAASGYLIPRELAESGGRVLWLHKSCKISLVKSLESVLLDRVSDISVSIVALLPAILFITNVVNGLTAFAITSVLLVINVLFFSKLIHILCLLIQWLKMLNVGGSRITNRIDELLAKLLEIRIVKQQAWRKIITFSIIKYILLVMRVILIASAIQIDISGLNLSLFFPISQVAYLIAFTPGGIGVYDAGWFGLFGLIGIELVKVALFILMIRLNMLVSILFYVPIVLLIRRNHFDNVNS